MAAPDDTAGKPAKKSVTKPAAAAAHGASQPERPSGTPSAVTAGGLPPRLIWLIVGIIVVAVAVIVGIWVFLPDLFVPDNVQPTETDPNARVTAEISARSPLGVLSGAVMAAAAAAIGVVVSHHTASLTRATLEETQAANAETRRSNDLTDQRAVAGARDDRFTKAVEQLGHAAAAVRLGAMHSLARLADEDRERVPTVVDILCAYLRQPFHHPDHDAPAGAPAGDPVGASTDAAQGQGAGEKGDGELDGVPEATARQARQDRWTPADERERELRDAEAEVRRTAQRLVTATLALLDEDAPLIEVNLRGAKLLDDFVLTGRRLGRVDLTRVYLTGSVQLGINTHVHGDLNLGESAHVHGDLQVVAGAHIDGDLMLGKDAHIDGALWLEKGAHIDGDLQLWDGAYVHGDLQLWESAHVHGRLQLEVGAHIHGDLMLGKGAHIAGALRLDEDAHIGGDLMLGEDAHVHGNLAVWENAHIDGHLMLGQDAHIDGNLYLEKGAHIDGDLMLGRDAHVHGHLSLGQGAHIGGRGRRPR